MNKEDNSCATCSLRHCTILKNCREEFLELIDRNKYCLKYVKGQQLFREGSEAEGIFVINSGVVKVQVKGFRKRPFILYLGMVGDMIGYQTSADKKNQVSAIAVETTNVCFIENKDFDSILKNNAIVREDLTKEFNRELSKIYLRAVRIAQMNIREKIADALLMIARVYQLNHSTEPFEVNLGRDDIGDMIGINKEQVSKNFTELKKEKIIVTSGKHLQILNYSKLEEIAAM